MALETLKDKVAVVTGSARGVGWATVHALAAEGARVVVADRTEKPRPDLDDEGHHLRRGLRDQ